MGTCRIEMKTAAHDWRQVGMKTTEAAARLTARAFSQSGGMVRVVDDDGNILEGTGYPTANLPTDDELRAAVAYHMANR